MIVISVSGFVALLNKGCILKKGVRNAVYLLYVIVYSRMDVCFYCVALFFKLLIIIVFFFLDVQNQFGYLIF